MHYRLFLLVWLLSWLPSSEALAKRKLEVLELRAGKEGLCRGRISQRRGDPGGALREQRRPDLGLQPGSLLRTEPPVQGCDRPVQGIPPDSDQASRGRARGTWRSTSQTASRSSGKRHPRPRPHHSLPRPCPRRPRWRRRPWSCSSSPPRHRHPTQLTEQPCAPPALSSVASASPLLPRPSASM